MTQRRWVIAAAVIAVPIAAVLWYLFRPELLFIDRTVNEALPTTASAPVTAPAPPGVSAPPGTSSPSAATASGAAGASSVAAPAIVTKGNFIGLAHETKGTAAVYRLADGKRVLRLSEFETSNGPDVRVYLVAAPDARDNQTVTKAGFVDLGAMKGNRGDQNYEVTTDLDLDRYRAVSIWCRRFSVNFGTAALSPPR